MLGQQRRLRVATRELPPRTVYKLAPHWIIRLGHCRGDQTRGKNEHDSGSSRRERAGTRERKRVCTAKSARPSGRTRLWEDHQQVPLTALVWAGPLKLAEFIAADFGPCKYAAGAPLPSVRQSTSRGRRSRLGPASVRAAASLFGQRGARPHRLVASSQSTWKNVRAPTRSGGGETLRLFAPAVVRADFPNKRARRPAKCISLSRSLLLRPF